MSRYSKDEYFTDMALLVSKRGTCTRRQVGCVLINSLSHVIATGYNGPPSGFTHCIDSPCPGALQPPGMGLDLCEAVHAEQNALLQCKNIWDISVAYCTDSPCVHCVKLLLNTSCNRIVFIREYPHARSRELWLSRGGNTWIHFGKH